MLSSSETGYFPFRYTALFYRSLLPADERASHWGTDVPYRSLTVKKSYVLETGCEWRITEVYCRGGDKAADFPLQPLHPGGGPRDSYNHYFTTRWNWSGPWKHQVNSPEITRRDLSTNRGFPRFKQRSYRYCLVVNWAWRRIVHNVIFQLTGDEYLCK